MPTIFNPGSSPVPDATEEQAQENLLALFEDLASWFNIKVTGWKRTPDRDDERNFGSGRYAFEVTTDYGRTIEIHMPGCALQRVKEEWTRIYVDGSSWYWEYAVRQMRPLER